METFSQLVTASDGGGYEIVPVTVSDTPRFGWVRTGSRPS
jgi:hypothetical protein